MCSIRLSSPKMASSCIFEQDNCGEHEFCLKNSFGEVAVYEKKGGCPER